MRKFVVTLALAFVAAFASAPPTVWAQAPAAPPVAGSWTGKVSTNAGEMEITVNVKSADGKITGVIESAHGSWPITGGALKDGAWTLKFNSGGNDPWMKGQIKGDAFTGDWNNEPMAVGTFELMRVKK